MSNANSTPDSSQSPVNPQMYPAMEKRSVSMYYNIGFICALIGLFLFPEVFGSAAIILGAYVWRMERDEKRNRGVMLEVAGIVAMLIGIYYTSFYGLYNILP